MAVAPQPPPSKLVIEFAAPGSTEFNVIPQGIVTVAQLEVVAHDLLATAQYTRWAQIHQAALEQQAQGDKEQKESQIIVPGMHPGHVDDILRGMK